MEIIKTGIPEVFLIKPRVFKDDRGYFFESYNTAAFEKQVGFLPDFVQDNESKSSYGVLRGLHYQLEPFAQAKLVRVVQGRVLDVAVDIRKGSPTFGQHVSTILSSDQKEQLFIPRGFAHGFVVLSKEAVFSYKCDNFYSSEHEESILYNDPDLNINWGIEAEHIKVSEKDLNARSFKSAIY